MTRTEISLHFDGNDPDFDFDSKLTTLCTKNLFVQSTCKQMTVLLKNLMKPNLLSQMTR